MKKEEDFKPRFEFVLEIPMGPTCFPPSCFGQYGMHIECEYCKYENPCLMKSVRDSKDLFTLTP